MPNWPRIAGAALAVLLSAAFWIAFLALLAGCSKVKLQRGDMPEAPPSWAKDMGPAPGYSVKRFDTLEALRDYCRANNVSANDAYAKRDFMACVIPAKQEEVLPAKGLLHDPVREEAIEDHEDFHTRGPVHVGGKGWFVHGPAGLMPVTRPSDLLWAQKSILKPTQTAASVLTVSPR